MIDPVNIVSPEERDLDMEGKRVEEDLESMKNILCQLWAVTLLQPDILATVQGVLELFRC